MYFVIVLAVMAVSTLGGLITQGGMAWYDTLELPGFTPPGSVIGMVWTLIYVSCAIAAMLIWRNRMRIQRAGLIFFLLILNGLLNLGWSWIFFGLHAMDLAVVEMILLNLTNLLIIVMCWRDQRIASVLFLPYFVWVCFATYLAIQIWQLNS